VPAASLRALAAAIERLQIGEAVFLGEFMERESNPRENTFYHRVIQTKLGQVLRAQYEPDLAQPLPHRLLTILMQLNEQHDTDRDKRPGQKTPAG